MRLLSFWASHQSELLTLLRQHVFLVALSTTVAVALGVPAGILAAHRPRIGRPLVAFAGVAQTIPSLALFGFLLPVPIVGGIGPRVAVAALILYGLLPILRATAAGLRGIDPAVTEAGVAMGMTPRQLLWMVQLPLALPSIVAGVRIAAVVGVGTATIAAAVGAGGLGEYIYRGLSMVDATVILAGAIPAALLALAADGALTWIERWLSPARQRRGRIVPVAVAGLLAAGGIIAAGTPGVGDREAIVVGSKNFTEQVVLGELIAQTLEASGFGVIRRLNLGGTFICDQAIRSGDIDVYVEYTGTALTAILREPIGGSRDTVLERVRNAYGVAGLSVLPPLGFNNTFAILVRRADAEALGLQTIGDLQKVTGRFRPGFGYEFVERADGYRGLSQAYDLEFASEPRVMELSLIYRALAAGEVDVVAGDATSALIDSLDLVVLEDDRQYFPPYHAVPIVRSALLLRSPAVGAALARLSGLISEGEMRALNREVDVSRRDVAAVVREFLGRQ